MEKMSILTGVEKLTRKGAEIPLTGRGKVIQDHFDELIDEILIAYASKK